MNAAKRFRTKSPNLVSEIIDDEAVIINLVKGSYYTLDKAGAVVWRCITAGTTGGDIVESVLQLYDGDPIEVERAVESLLEQMEVESLVLADEVPSPQALPQKVTLERDSQEIQKSVFEVPTLNKYTDMEAILMLDPIHEVDKTGWPNADSGSKNSA